MSGLGALSWKPGDMHGEMRAVLHCGDRATGTSVVIQPHWNSETVMRLLVGKWLGVYDSSTGEQPRRDVRADVGVNDRAAHIQDMSLTSQGATP